MTTENNPAPAPVSQQFKLHPSSASPTQDRSTYTAPALDWLHGTWHVTHSTLPMWKSKSDVCITYSPISDSDKLDDLVTYHSSHPSPKNPTTKPKEKSVHGTSSPTVGKPGEFDWRGKGWLMIASSHWEVLGWGTTERGFDWVVTYFAKTLFTPAGADIYLRKVEGESGGGKGTGEGGIEEGIRQAMKALGEQGDPEMKRLEPQLFAVARD